MLITKEVLFEFPNKWISHTFEFYKEVQPQEINVPIAEVYFWNNKYHVMYNSELYEALFMKKYCVISESGVQEIDILSILKFEHPFDLTPYKIAFYRIQWDVIDSSLYLIVNVDYIEYDYDVVIEQLGSKVCCVVSADLYPAVSHKKLFVWNIDKDSRRLILIGSKKDNPVGIGEKVCLIPIKLKKVKALLIRRNEKKEIELPVRYLDIRGDFNRYTHEVNFVMDQNNLFLLGRITDFERQSLIVHRFSSSKVARSRKSICSEYYASQPIITNPYERNHCYLNEGVIERLLLIKSQTVVSAYPFITATGNTLNSFRG